MPPGIANVDVVPATDVAKFRTYRHSGCQGQEHPGGNKGCPARRDFRIVAGVRQPALKIAALLRVVRTGSEVGVDEGGCSPTRAEARCACRLSRIRSAAGTPATPAIAAKEGSRCGRLRRRTVEGMEMRTFGEKEGSFLAAGQCACWRRKAGQRDSRDHAFERRARQGPVHSDSSGTLSASRLRVSRAGRSGP